MKEVSEATAFRRPKKGPCNMAARQAAFGRTGLRNKTTGGVQRKTEQCEQGFISLLMMAAQRCSHMVITGTKGRDLSLGFGIAKIRDKAVFS